LVAVNQATNYKTYNRRFSCFHLPENAAALFGLRSSPILEYKFIEGKKRETVVAAVLVRARSEKRKKILVYGIIEMIIARAAQPWIV
jgi:hypothetical protein